MYCWFCGKSIPDGTAVCPACGTQLNEDASQVQTPEQPAYQEPSFQEPSYQEASYQEPSYQETSYQEPGIGETTQLDYSAQPEDYRTAYQPGYQQPEYQAPAQPGYQQTDYQQTAQPIYQQPGYQPIRQSYPQPKYAIPNQMAAAYTAPQSPKAASSGGAGRVLAVFLAFAALASVLVAGILFIIDYADSLSQVSKYSSLYSGSTINNLRYTYIMLIVDNGFRIVCLLTFALQCTRLKKASALSTAIPLLLYTVPTLKYLAAGLFNFKIFDTPYHYDTEDAIMIGLFTVGVILYLVAVAMKQNQLIPKIISALMMLGAVGLAIRAMVDRLDLVSGYKSDAATKMRVETIFGFIATLAIALTMIIVMFTVDSSKKKQPAYE